MELIKSAYHRNGISGTPFTVGIIDKEIEGKTTTLLIVQFDSGKTETAVFDFELLKRGIIEFGKNSWRGDEFADEFEEKTA